MMSSGPSSLMSPTATLTTPLYLVLDVSNGRHDWTRFPVFGSMIRTVPFLVETTVNAPVEVGLPPLPLEVPSIDPMSICDPLTRGLPIWSVVRLSGLDPESRAGLSLTREWKKVPLLDFRSAP